MNTPWTIRTAKKEDVQALCSVYETFRERFRLLDDMQWVFNMPLPKEDAFLPFVEASQILLAEVDQQPVGYMIAVQYEKVLDISTLIIKPNAYDHKIRSNFLAIAEKLAYLLGLEALVFAEERHTGSNEMYFKAQGFEELAEPSQYSLDIWEKCRQYGMPDGMGVVWRKHLTPRQISGFTLSESDLVDAARLDRKIAWIGRKKLLFYGVCAFAFWLFFLYKMAKDGPWDPVKTGFAIAFWPFVIGCFVAGYQYWLKYLIPLRIKRLFKNEPDRRDPISYIWDGEGIYYWNLPDDLFCEWSRFYSYEEGEELFLLYMDEDEFFTIPKRAMSGEQIEMFRQIITTKITKRT